MERVGAPDTGFGRTFASESVRSLQTTRCIVVFVLTQSFDFKHLYCRLMDLISVSLFSSIHKIILNCHQHLMKSYPSLTTGSKATFDFYISIPTSNLDLSHNRESIKLGSWCKESGWRRILFDHFHRLLSGLSMHKEGVEDIWAPFIDGKYQRQVEEVCLESCEWRKCRL